MRAILVKDGRGPLENLYLGEAEKPIPGPGKVLVKVWICCLCCNTIADTAIRLSFSV